MADASAKIIARIQTQCEAEDKSSRTPEGMRRNVQGYADELWGIAWDLREDGCDQIACELERIAENMKDDFR